MVLANAGVCKLQRPSVDKWIKRRAFLTFGRGRTAWKSWRKYPHSSQFWIQC